MVDPTSNDDYVAQILANDARDSSLKYSTLGMEAYLPQSQRRGDAPKPNTRFLKNILRETDSHNASLRRKEEYSSRETLSRHRRTKSDRGRDKRENRTTSTPRSHASKNEELLGYRDEDRSRSHRSSRTDHATDSDTDRHKSLSRKHRRRHGDERHRSKHQRERSRSPNRSSRYDESRYRRRRHWHRHASSRSSSRSPPRPSSPSTSSPRKALNDDKSIRRRHLRGLTQASSPQSSVHRLLEGSQNELKEVVTESSLSTFIGNHLPSEESDPLEDLLGPLPPPSNNVHDSSLIRSRGRGAYRINTSNIDTHFATDYNPALDIHLDGENTAPSTRLSRRPVAGLMTKDDDWDMALEALRDRALWRENSADRLRAAGFTEQVVDRFANNASAGSTRSEKDGRIGSFKWSKKGESREWDRGKVMDQDGHFDVKAPW
ncbi:hypothetical protein Egran_04086 [Elaphomyces granulatus]|uniref:Uncharacterized protein n=1 Tax=Elaphomyces granulatus TaxID=519963 RepID=A0A232LVI0_9EURO|nr:hypothetical protein Egran_04086 [Elaphomyces granulatus]